MDTNGFLTIRQLVMTIKNRGQDYSMTHYKYWFQLVIEAIGHLNIFTSSQFRVAYLTLTERATIPLPNDYVDYTKIGIINSCGEMWTLTLAPNILPTPIQECGEDLTAALQGRCNCENGVYWAPHFYNGNFLATPYSLGGGFNRGYYRVDQQGRNLIITGLPAGTTIVLEYKSTGVGLNEVTLVRKSQMEPIISWCMMTAQQYSIIKSPINWEMKHYGDMNEFENLEYALTLEEFNDILYREWKQGPKR